MQYRLSIIEGGRTSVYGNEIITGFPPGQCPCRTVSGITGFLPPVRFVLKKSSIPQGIMRMAEDGGEDDGNDGETEKSGTEVQDIFRILRGA